MIDGAGKRARGFFVTGTDTGVGKTVVSCALVRALAAEGLDVAAMKPVETGVGSAGPLDAQALRAAAGGRDDLDLVCPERFSLAAAPNVAAAAEAQVVNLERVRKAFEVLAAAHECLIVEGAGGLLVPLDGESDMGDLARQLALPLIVVARTALGTINHTLLTLREIERRQLDFAGVVLSNASGRLAEADRANLDHLRGELGEWLLGEIPVLEDREEPAPDCLDVSSLVARLR